MNDLPKEGSFVLQSHVPTLDKVEEDSATQNNESYNEEEEASNQQKKPKGRHGCPKQPAQTTDYHDWHFNMHHIKSRAPTNINPPDHPKNIPRDFISSVQSLEPRIVGLHHEVDANDTSVLQTLEEKKKDLKKQLQEMVKQKAHETWLGYLCTQCCLKINKKQSSIANR
eukprot:1219317-Ditylum_brightwellii.AAC.1